MGGMRWLWIVDLVMKIAYSVVDALTKMNGSDDQGDEVKKACCHVMDPERPETSVTESVPVPRPPA